MNEKEILTAALDAVTKSIEMWSWLYQHPGCTKVDYFRFKNIKLCAAPANGCHLCQFALKYAWEYDPGGFQNNSLLVCSLCPIAWTCVHCNSSRSPYHLWATESDVGIRKQATADMLKILYKTKRRLKAEIFLAAEDERRKS